ncbi:carbonyl reductase [NADPH] 1-like isoform X2 [Alosa sapidissima]|uniref:carbonyl reductase [NADPH] 1-like isoform X2 n=1 Tax=Alosa sapidissima TaxID=34773 RepID=UPI001C093E15|nr:carbonyl reductase [NADPH] 1-like isoform X2 [Alosa sapidissima]
MAKQVAVVTGANKGIGLAIVQGLCKAGYAGDIILTARNEKLGQETLQKLKSEGFNNVLFHRLDICDQTSAEGLRKFLDKNYGGLDVLINNAGIAFKVDATEPFGEQAEVTMRTNFWGTLWASKALLPLLRPNARVVNVSSFFSKRALDKCSPELQAKFRSADISEEELCGLMGEFVVAAQNGNHEAKGWPNTAYGATKVTPNTAYGITKVTLYTAYGTSKVTLNKAYGITKVGIAVLLVYLTATALSSAGWRNGAVPYPGACSGPDAGG